jgi:predicted Zn-dependent protease with MMP-like domain
MDEETFEQVVVEVLEGLPTEFGAAFENIEVLIEDRPRPEHRRAVRLKPWHTLYGLYQGVPLPARTHNYGLVAPDTITIFREPLLRDFPQPIQLREQIRRTVLHEIAHYFGIDDDRLHELGAY